MTTAPGGSPVRAAAPAVSAETLARTLVAALAGGAWVVLAAADASAWGRYLHHDGLAVAGLSAPISVAVFVGGWVVMLAAMMLPTTYPLVRIFDGMVAIRDDATRLLLLLVAGYLTVWTLAGLAAYGLDLGVHAAVEAVPFVEEHEWLLAVTVLAGAGAYQLSALKERCLTRCRNPRAVLMLRWRGQLPGTEAFMIGAGHGAECLSCCWALMLVLFALGAGNLGWMLAAAAVMALEKTAPGGTRLRQPIGVGLLAMAVVVAVLNM
jgi:predicted metal-binding membrane protein